MLNVVSDKCQGICEECEVKLMCHTLLMEDIEVKEWQVLNIEDVQLSNWEVAT